MLHGSPSLMWIGVVAMLVAFPAARGGRCGDDVTELVGPWGALQAYDVLIAAPEGVLDLARLPSAQTVWTFDGLTTDEVARVLEQPTLPADAARDVLDRSRWVVVDKRIQVSPSFETVLSLPPEVRRAIYDVLAMCPENEFQADPFYVPRGDVRWWLAGAGIREELVAAVERTAYPINKSLAFSDLPLLISMTTSRSEARDVLKALSRTATSIIRLRLDGESDLEKIRGYWSSGRANAKDFMPLLESTATNPRIRHLDLVHILPPYARKLLYTYPHPSLAVGGRYPDCHWTCLNFFNYRPEQRLIDTAGANMLVNEEYEQGAAPYGYGDILFLTTPDGESIHSCIHLAADFVFTKNGPSVFAPWVIMRLEDVRERYSRHGPVEVLVYRRRQ